MSRERVVLGCLGLVAVLAVAGFVVTWRSDSARAALAADGALTVGITFDRPGVGYRAPDGSFRGFDVEIARYVGKHLGFDEVTFKEATAAQRAALLSAGTVDFVVTDYPMTADPHQVDFAGPYYVGGQSLLVATANIDITVPAALEGRRLCSVRGSSAAAALQAEYAKGAHLVERDTLYACVDAVRTGGADAMTGDDLTLAGQAAQFPAQVKVVPKRFTSTPYGIALREGDKSSRRKINDALRRMIDDGSWERAYRNTIGPSGYALPDPPAILR